MTDPGCPADSRILKKLVPPQAGTKRLADRYGDALVCVRYRVDAQSQRRYTTVELVVDVGRLPESSGHLEVLVRVAFGETDLRRRVKAAGGRWDPASKLWRLPRATARTLGLLRRIVRTPGGHA